MKDRILTIIKETGLKQREFAKTLGITENYISLLINGKKDTVSETLALLIQEKYGYSAKWITTGEGNKFGDGKNSFIKNKTIKLINELSDEEAKSVIAFVKSFEDLRRIFEQTETEKESSEESGNDSSKKENIGEM